MRGLPVILGRADWLMSEGIKIPYEIDSALSDSRHAGYGASVLAIDGEAVAAFTFAHDDACLLYTSPSPRDRSLSRMPSSA